jgi:hypothetical protein
MPEPAEADAKRTTYVILWKARDADAWTQLGPADGSNQKDAIRAVANRHPDNKDGDYVAVPETSWKPTPVTVEQKTVISIGRAG